MNELLSHRPAFELVAWAIVLALVLCAMGWVVLLERRHFVRLGKQRSWARLRLASVAILAFTLAAVVVPARLSTGMEALGYFYVLLFTAGPLVWFGLHVLTGRVLSPRLTTGESTLVALLGIVLMILGPFIAGTLQTPIWMASRAWEQRAYSSADQAPLVHEVQPFQRFQLGGVADLYAVSLLATDAVSLERVDIRRGESWHDTATSTHSDFCRDGDDLHVSWVTGSNPPSLRLYWRNQDNGRVRADVEFDAAVARAAPANPFTVGWRQDGFDLPAPLSRDRVFLGWHGAGSDMNYRSLNPLQTGETFTDDCVMPGYRRVDWESEGPVQALMLIFHLPPPADALRYEIHRDPPG